MVAASVARGKYGDAHRAVPDERAADQGGGVMADEPREQDPDELERRLVVAFRQMALPDRLALVRMAEVFAAVHNDTARP